MNIKKKILLVAFLLIGLIAAGYAGWRYQMAEQEKARVLLATNLLREASGRTNFWLDVLTHSRNMTYGDAFDRIKTSRADADKTVMAFYSTDSSVGGSQRDLVKKYLDENAKFLEKLQIYFVSEFESNLTEGKSRNQREALQRENNSDRLVLGARLGEVKALATKLLPHVPADALVSMATIDKLSARFPP